MDEDDDVVEIVPADSAACRPDLYAARTRLRDPEGQRYDFWGLYCERDLQPGDFIGMYAGMWLHRSRAFPFGNRYAVELSHGMTVAPPGQRPDPRRYPIAMANEPRPGERANAVLHEWVLGRDDVAQPPPDQSVFFGVGLVACAAIPRQTEICWHYGPSYQALPDYPVGEACTVTDVRHPTQALGHPLPNDAVSPWVDTPSASSDSDDDPSYGGGLLARLLVRRSRGLEG